MAAVRAGKELDRMAFRGYLPTINIALQRVRKMPQDANAGAYYKAAGELRAFAEDYIGAVELLGQAVELFKTEGADKIGGLINASNDLKEFCEMQIAAQGRTASDSQPVASSVATAGETAAGSGI